MSAPTLDAIQRDGLAMSVARAITVANETAAEQGVDPSAFLISVTEEGVAPDRAWRIHYGPRDYIRRRGGDLTVIVAEADGTVHRVIRGQ